MNIKKKKKNPQDYGLWLFFSQRDFYFIVIPGDKSFRNIYLTAPFYLQKQ